MNLFDMMGSNGDAAGAGAGGADPMAGIADWINAHKQRQALAQTSALANRAMVGGPTPSAAQPSAPVGSPTAMAGYGPQIVRALQAAMARRQAAQAGGGMPGTQALANANGAQQSGQMQSGIDANTMAMIMQHMGLPPGFGGGGGGADMPAFGPR